MLGHLEELHSSSSVKHLVPTSRGTALAVHPYFIPGTLEPSGAHGKLLDEEMKIIQICCSPALLRKRVCVRV